MWHRPHIQGGISMENENTFQDVCPECDSPSHPKKGFKGLLQKIKKLSWKAWLIIAIVAAILLGLGQFSYDRLTNTYKTPLDRYMDYLNSRDYSVDIEAAMLNGFIEEEFNLFGICMKLSEDYSETREDEFEQMVRNFEKTYGKDYKFYYKIDGKSKLERQELKEFEDELKDTAAFIKEGLTELYDQEYLMEHYGLNADKLEDFADAKGMTLLQAKLYIGALQNLRKEFKNIEVTEGYELTVIIIVTGSKLDEPREYEMTKYVYKVDGRWICPEFLKNAFSSL